MIEVTEHTRRKNGGATCQICDDAIRPGERYRQLIGMDTDVFDEGFVRRLAHRSCCGNSEGWELTTDRVERKRVAKSKVDHAIADWNEHHPPGTAVRYWPWAVGDESESQGETCGPAYLSSSGTPMVRVGSAGGVALTHVRVM